MRSSLPILALAAAASLPNLAQAQRTPLPTLPISAAVGVVEGEPVVEPWWVTEQVARANEIFGPYGVRFDLVERRELGERWSKLETRDDRHALGALMRPKVINWFVVESLRDVDDTSRYRQGVHWRPRGQPQGTHFVVTSKIAGRSVLAHELGHFFGNRLHSKIPGNLMSYTHTESRPYLSAFQAARVERFARRFLASGELLPTAALASPAESD